MQTRNTDIQITETQITKNMALIHQRAPDFAPHIGFILGSGVGKFTDIIQHPVIIPYEELDGMRLCTVEGHSGMLYLGTLNNVPVACFQGRNHFYEGYDSSVIQTPVRLLKQLGVKTLVVISAVGSLTSDMPPGSLVMITDHINMQCHNPLVGLNDTGWGPRFPSMENAYDPNLRHLMKQVASELKIPLLEGVYIGVLGPSFETPAEIRAFRIMGADVVGMSTVPEVITARHCGINVIAISVVTNMAAGLTPDAIDHKLSLITAEKTVDQLSLLLTTFIEKTTTSHHP